MTDERTSDGSASEQTVPNPEPSVRAGGGAPSDRTSPVVVHGDCVAEMRKMPDASVDAIVTDPPFGLEFMGKKWDRLDGEVVDDPAAEGGFQDGAGGNPYSRSRVRYGTKTDADGFRRSENPADVDRDDVFGRTRDRKSVV